jgi:tetratricopeptide (TPR) repeat protein
MVTAQGGARLLASIERIASTPVARSLLVTLRWILRFVPVARHRVAVLNGMRRVEALESSGRLTEARAARAALLAAVPPQCSAPLWRSEGDDLFRAKNYSGALAAFEQAASALEQSAALYGVSRPDAIFYGAAASALMVGDVERARKYHSKLEESVQYFRSMPALAPYVAELDRRLAWLTENLDPAADAGSSAGEPPGPSVH